MAPLIKSDDKISTLLNKNQNIDIDEVDRKLLILNNKIQETLMKSYQKNIKQ